MVQGHCSSSLSLMMRTQVPKSSSWLWSESDSDTVSWVWKEFSVCLSTYTRNLGDFLIGERFAKFGSSVESISLAVGFLRGMELLMFSPEAIIFAGIVFVLRLVVVAFFSSLRAFRRVENDMMARFEDLSLPANGINLGSSFLRVGLPFPIGDDGGESIVEFMLD